MYVVMEDGQPQCVLTTEAAWDKWKEKRQARLRADGFTIFHGLGNYVKATKDKVWVEIQAVKVPCLKTKDV